MKVITEEVLRKILKRHFGDDLTNQSLASHLANELQELDTLTVKKLRPMCEAKDGQEILVKFMWGDELIKVEYSDEGGVYREDGSYYDMDECDGFIPMPRYEPEKV